MLENLKPPKRSYTCKVAQEADKLEGPDKDIFLDAVADPKWKYKTLQNELVKYNIYVVDTTIAKHRAQACACYRD